LQNGLQNTRCLVDGRAAVVPTRDTLGRWAGALSLRYLVESRRFLGRKRRYNILESRPLVRGDALAGRPNYSSAL
jgi:hypothetical protein